MLLQSKFYEENFFISLQLGPNIKLLLNILCSNHMRMITIAHHNFFSICCDWYVNNNIWTSVYCERNRNFFIKFFYQIIGFFILWFRYLNGFILRLKGWNFDKDISPKTLLPHIDHISYIRGKRFLDLRIRTCDSSSMLWNRFQVFEWW